MNDINKAFSDYLKSGNFYSFMHAWKQQVHKIGVVGGTVNVPLTSENQKDIEGLLGKAYHKQSHAKISWKQLKKSLEITVYEGVDFKRVLELYFEETFMTKLEKNKIVRLETDEFLQDILNENIGVLSKLWIEEVLSNKNGVYMSVLQHKTKSHELKSEFMLILKALEKLPVHFKKTESIAIFAAQITGDPHAFDHDSPLYYLLIQAISYLLDITQYPSSIRERNQILYRGGLYKEDINNYCSIYGLNAIKENAHHLAWNGFYIYKESWNVNISNIIKIDSIDPTCAKIVFIIENPSIYETLVKVVIQNNIEQVGLVCSNGQPTQAVYALLDKIQVANVKMLYAGDFDPEGLLMAQRILDQYSNCDLWLYRQENFYQQLSNKKATNQRISMFKHLEDVDLKNMGTLITEFGLGYQENMIGAYIEDLLQYKEI